MLHQFLVDPTPYETVRNGGSEAPDQYKAVQIICYLTDDGVSRTALKKIILNLKMELEDEWWSSHLLSL